MKNSVLAVIPARLASERLPEKPLLLIAGQPLIRRVYEAVINTDLFSDVIILTDSEAITDCAEMFGGKTLTTSVSCRSGTDRILEVRDRLEGDIIINVQGDEPFIDRDSLTKLIESFRDKNVVIASLMNREDDLAVLTSPNIVKVVVDNDSNALFFSRSLIPFQRDKGSENKIIYYRHIGVYAFRKNVLDNLSELSPGYLEQIEKLEQLRWLEYGYKIRMIETEYEGFGIDTEDDLKRAEEILKDIG